MDPQDQGTHEAMSVITPDAGTCYGSGWRRLWQYFLELLAVTIVVGAIGLPFYALSAADEVRSVGPICGILAFVYGVLIYGPARYGVAFVSLKAVRGTPPKVSDLFEVLQNYLNIVAANLLVLVIVTVGLIFLIVPGIVFACKLAFTPYLVVEKKMDAAEAIRESWRMTRGYALDVFLIGLLAIPIFIAGLIAFGLGAVISVMWIRLAFASLYQAACTASSASVSEVVPAS